MIVLDGLVKAPGHPENFCIRILGIGLSWKHFNVMLHDRKGLLKFSLECIIVSKIVKSAGKIRVQNCFQTPDDHAAADPEVGLG